MNVVRASICPLCHTRPTTPGGWCCVRCIGTDAERVFLYGDRVKREAEAVRILNGFAAFRES